MRIMTKQELWSEAEKLAAEKPYPIENPFPNFPRFTSIFYHLNDLNGGRFWLDVDELTRIFGKPYPIYYRWRDSLLLKGLIECVDEDFRIGKSKVFTWIGPTIPGTPSEGLAARA
jgi:hypothetical protein